MKLPDSIRALVDALAELPSIGPRQAIRLVFYLIGLGSNNIQNLSQNIDELKKIKICERCFFIHQNPDTLCDICRSPARRQDIIMIVEKETDLLSIENTSRFNGRYFIMGAISKTGILDDRQKLRLQNLKNFIANSKNSTHTSNTPDTTHSTGAVAGQALQPGSGQAEEIILGFNPTSHGDFNSSLVEKELKPLAKKITRLGRGLPTGGEIEFADDDTLGAALEKRN
ncbi:MAG: toprim domain-containing protein [Candidatus Liptonbacteria bacterium]|nr:toprim domain-containing protein [Candidatus Liptonbacteria bacterium]